MKKILLSALTIGAVTVNLSAGCVANGWCSDVKVERIHVADSGVIRIKTDGDQTVLPCTSAGSNTYLQLKDGEGKNALYSFLLTAKTTGEPILIRVDSGADCKVAYAY